MDEPYEQLRKQAAAKRDKIIANARQEYRVAVRRIRALHKLVEGDAHPMVRPPRRPAERSLNDMLTELLPTDRAFTVADACDLVYADPLGCKYKENSIRTAFPVLAGLGVIVKVGRRNGHVTWARPEAKIEPDVFGAMSLCDIAELLIRERGPMRLQEIVATMKERGYRPEEPALITHKNLQNAMKRITGRFLKDEKGRWLVAS